MEIVKIEFQNENICAKVESYRSEPENLNMNDDMVRIEMCLNKHTWRRMKKHLSLDSWIDVNDHLPTIPPNKYSISVLVVMFDPVFEEIHPGGGATTEECVFDGKQFLELGTDGNTGWKFMPTSNPITHWMYKPAPIRKRG